MSELRPDVFVLLLQFRIDFLNINLEFLKTLVFALEVGLKVSQFLFPKQLLVFKLCVIFGPCLEKLLLELSKLRLFDALILQLKVQDIRDITNHRGQLDN